MFASLRDQLLALALPLLVAPLAVFFGRIALNAHAAIDKLDASVKQLVVLGIAAVLTWVAQTYVPGFLPENLATLADADWHAFASWIAALLLHANIKQPSSPKPGA